MRSVHYKGTAVAQEKAKERLGDLATDSSHEGLHNLHGRDYTLIVANSSNTNKAQNGTSLSQSVHFTNSDTSSMNNERESNENPPAASSEKTSHMPIHGDNSNNLAFQQPSTSDVSHGQAPLQNIEDHSSRKSYEETTGAGSDHVVGEMGEQHVKTGGANAGSSIGAENQNVTSSEAGDLGDQEADDDGQGESIVDSLDDEEGGQGPVITLPRTGSSPSGEGSNDSKEERGETGGKMKAADTIRTEAPDSRKATDGVADRSTAQMTSELQRSQSEQVTRETYAQSRDTRR